MFYTSGKEMGAPTGNWLYDSVRELTEMASMQFAVYGLMNPYTYQRPKITPLPNETGLTVPGGTGVAVVPNGTAPALKQPYLPGQYTEYPAAVQGWAQQALPGGGSGIETSYGESSGNISELLENRPELTGTNREKLLSMVQDTKLAAYINEVYRPGASVGDGGTADKLIMEFYEGSSRHLPKAKERLVGINRIIDSGKLGLNDLDIAEALRDDLEYAIDLFK